MRAPFWMMTPTPALEAWLLALESGEYVQGEVVLRNCDTFCCLGVACDLYCKETGEGSWEEGYSLSSSRRFKWVTADGAESFANTALPDPVTEWLLGRNPYADASSEERVSDIDLVYLNWNKGRYLHEKGLATLIGLNDNLHANFSTIAKAVRANLAGKVLCFGGPRDGELEDPDPAWNL